MGAKIIVPERFMTKPTYFALARPKLQRTDMWGLFFEFGAAGGSQVVKRPVNAHANTRLLTPVPQLHYQPVLKPTILNFKLMSSRELL